MEILEILETNWQELYGISIYGLCITKVNKNTGSLEDPTMTFLREVLSAYPCAAHMSRDPQDDEPLETFSASYDKERFILTPVGIYSHVSLTIEKNKRFCGVYFPRFFPDDLLALDEDGESLIDYLIHVDQPALYVNVDENNEPRLRELFLNPPVFSKDFIIDWFRAATEIVPLIIIGGQDESRFHVISRSQENFALLDQPIKNTEKSIVESEWFKTNADNLVMSEESYEWCLVLPCDTYHPRIKSNEENINDHPIP